MTAHKDESPLYREGYSDGNAQRPPKKMDREYLRGFRQGQINLQAFTGMMNDVLKGRI